MFCSSLDFQKLCHSVAEDAAEVGGVVDFDVGTGGVGGRGVEEGHALVCAGCDLVVHKVIVQGKIEGGNAEYVDGSSMGEGGDCIALIGVAGARPAETNVVAQIEPLDGRD